MPAIYFFTLIFSSLLWLIIALRFVAENLNGISFLDAGIANLIMYVLLVCLPIFLMWLVFGHINQYLTNRQTHQQLQKLFAQMKRNQDYSDLLSRILIETEQQIKDGFILGKFDLLVADMNELLAEIIHGSKLASGEQIERLWSKVQNGGKWSFGKVIIEINNSQPNFQMRLYEKACRDLMLGGTIMEFCARYTGLVAMLEKHDKEKTFLNMIETGVMGKVFSIMAPIAEEIRRTRESAAGFAAQSRQTVYPTARASEPAAPRPAPMPMGAVTDEEVKPSLLGKINVFKKKPNRPARLEPEIKEPDPFSMALERSFGTPAEAETEAPRLRMSADVSQEETMPAPTIAAPEFEEPRFEITPPAEEDVFAEAPILQNSEAAETEAPLSSTQQTLNNLRKEWNDFKQPPADEDDNGENPAYPFGGWVDEDNYHK